MLVLSRNPNESIQIGDDIRVVVCEVRGQQVRLGIEAPEEVPIARNHTIAMLGTSSQFLSASTIALRAVVAEDSAALCDIISHLEARPDVKSNRVRQALAAACLLEDILQELRRQ
jgi:carbon storage regulator